MVEQKPSKLTTRVRFPSPAPAPLRLHHHELTAHGFRAMATTLLNESGKWNPDAIERALAHRDKVHAAYHRGAHWKERVEMAQ